MSPSHTELRASQSDDVLIVGAGVIGLALAYRLLQAGRGVTVLDAGAAGSGSSHGNCGTITPSHAPPLHAPGQVAKALRWMLRRDAPLHVRLRWDPLLWAWLWRFARRCNRHDYQRGMTARAQLLIAARERLQALIEEAVLACDFESSGTAYVFRDAAELDEARTVAHQLNALGIASEVLDGVAMRRLEPALNDSIIGAVLHRGDARLRPHRYVAELTRVVCAAGGRIVENAPVSGFAAGGGRVSAVTAGDAAYHARDVVLALGAWTPLLARQLDVHVPVQPGKGYSITYTRPAVCPVLPLVLKERGVCVTSWAGEYRLGSTMEFAGYDASLNRRRLDALERGAAEYLRQPVGPRKIDEWYGWRPMCYDELPILGRAPHYDNLWLATGHGMLGVTMSAVTADLMCALITGVEPPLDPQPYDPGRFA